MKKTLSKITCCLLLLLLFAACSGKNDNPNGGEEPDVPVIDRPGEKVNKPVQLWIDAHANFSRLSSKANITTYLKQMKETGFNEIYLDVKPGIGHALYDSDILPKLTNWGSETPPINRGWDYLGFFIEEAEKLDISVIASISALGYGVPTLQEGPIYKDNRWDGKTQMEMIGNNPNNIVDIRTQTSANTAMLNPCLAEVQTFVVSIVEEIVTKYPKLKGICLDYCRWFGAYYGFSDATMAAFEVYSGERVTNRNDIITATNGVGPLYTKWIEFRSMAITNLVTNIRSAVKAIHPSMEIHLWADGYWGSRYQLGQNWASKKYTPSGYAYTDTYSKTGLADQMDVFSLGAYREHVWKSETSEGTVEGYVTSYSQYTMGDCKVCGSIFSYLYGSNKTAISDAVYLCLKNTDGVMVFDLSHVLNYDQWGAIKEGVGRVIK
ncbi:MAG: family 10 glycosylhydrolase [Prevotellaceae bacterium]|jgi:uncharacterized lipoprotein YddW (UPF0748 family)|nr:family 10 glycosylhydrolase [Prevotellaceae bacterium]